jgi:DNA gyrase subunit A
VLSVTEHGYGKRSPVGDYTRQSRYGKGLIDIKTVDRNGPTCAIDAVGPDDHLVVMSESGQILRTPVGNVSTVGRNTMGVIVMDLDGDDSVASVAVVPADRVGSDDDGNNNG